MEPRVRGAAPASPKIRPYGVTPVVFSMRHSLDCALSVVVYFPLDQCTDLNETGLFEQVSQTWTTPVSSGKCAKLERPRSLRASAPDVVPERAAVGCQVEGTTSEPVLP